MRARVAGPFDGGRWGDSEHARDSLERRLVSSPMFGEYLWSGHLRNASKDESGHNGVIKWSQHRDELRNEIYGRDEPNNAHDEQQLGSSRNAGVTDKPAEKPNEVRDECGEFSSR